MRTARRNLRQWRGWKRATRALESRSREDRGRYVRDRTRTVRTVNHGVRWGHVTCGEACERTQIARSVPPRTGARRGREAAGRMAEARRERPGGGGARRAAVSVCRVSRYYSVLECVRVRAQRPILWSYIVQRSATRTTSGLSCQRAAESPGRRGLSIAIAAICYMCTHQTQRDIRRRVHSVSFLGASPSP
jgi:hypothetical protein